MSSKYTLGLIKSSLASKPSSVIDIILTKIEEDKKLKIISFTETLIEKKQAEDFYAEHKGKPYFDRLVGSITGPGGVIILLLESTETNGNAITAWRDLIGPTDPVEARKTHPNCLRALFGEELPNNGFHGSDSPESYKKEMTIVKTWPGLRKATNKTMTTEEIKESEKESENLNKIYENTIVEDDEESRKAFEKAKEIHSLPYLCKFKDALQKETDENQKTRIELMLARHHDLYPSNTLMKAIFCGYIPITAASWLAWIHKKSQSDKDFIVEGNVDETIKKIAEAINIS